ncbi:Double-strand-specific pac1 ribonuclease [Tritrichomonas musculus]|uniref:Double-strand-specific pac1 ribonuclease n=1 Tax=Tritrichomonas musculus TaxID=1915356 RepID=A0ABR2KF39_9EUKA
MLRYFYKLSFFPKIPQAHAITDVPYSFQGNFYIISEYNYNLTDFRIRGDPIIPDEDAHITSPFMVYLSEEQLNDLNKFYNTSLHFYYRFSNKQFEELKMMVIPIVLISGETELQSTLQWISYFKISLYLKDIYFDLLRKYDKKNDGKKLHSSLYQNGEKIERFLRFIMTIDSPSVEEYIDSEPAINDQELSKQELILYIVSLKFQERIYDRIIWSELKNLHSASRRNYYHYFLGSVVSYSSHADQIMPEKKITYVEHYQKKHEVTNLDCTLPLLELVPLRKRYPSEKELYSEYTQYPQAFNHSHKLITEILLNHKLIPNLLNRIPNDFNMDPPQTDQLTPVKIPLEVLGTYYFPLFAGSIIYQINHILTQFRPIAIGTMNVEEITKLAAQKIEDVLGYKFKNLTYLRTALTDPSFHPRGNNIHSYQRLEYLGDCILDVTTTFSIFNSNENATESDMTFLKHSMVSNRTFASLTMALGLNNFVISSNQSVYTDKSKCSADIFESLFGAIFRDSNLSTCFKVYKTVVTNFVNIFKKAVKRFRYGMDTVNYILNSTEESFCKLNVNVDSDYFGQDFCINTKSLIRHLQLPNVSSPSDPRINRQVFTLAFTHSSYSKNQKNSYERLEFIGDIIVKLAIGVVLYFSFPTGNDSGLSITSSYYKSNDILGRVSLKMGLQDLILASETLNEAIHLNTEAASDVNIAINKIYGDLFESSTAAVAFCFGLNEGFKYVQQRVLGNHIENRPDNPQIDPVSHFTILCQRYFKMQPNFHVWEGQGRLYAYISIKGIQLPFIGEASEKNKALQNVSRLFFEVYENNNSYLEEVDKEIQEMDNENDDDRVYSFEVVCKDDLANQDELANE